MLDLQSNKTKTSRDELLRSLRDRAQNIFKEVTLATRYSDRDILTISSPPQYLLPMSSNCLNIDHGLIEALTIKLKETTLTPEQTWFDSICKYVYEKLKVISSFRCPSTTLTDRFNHKPFPEWRNFPDKFLPKLRLQETPARIGILRTEYRTHWLGIEPHSTGYR